MSLALIFALSIAEILGDTQLKFYSRTGNPVNFTIGIAGYAGVIYLLIKSLQMGNIIYVNGMWDGISALVETLFAFIILKETLNTPYQYIGIAFIVSGLVLLGLGGIKK
jgi:multidrug transporter EmrE-like cation transporter